MLELYHDANERDANTIPAAAAMELRGCDRSRGLVSVKNITSAIQLRGVEIGPQCGSSTVRSHDSQSAADTFVRFPAALERHGSPAGHLQSSGSVCRRGVPDAASPLLPWS
jgi:hypothetical protein